MDKGCSENQLFLPRLCRSIFEQVKLLTVLGMSRPGQGCLLGCSISRLGRGQPAVLAGTNAPAASRPESSVCNGGHSALQR